MMRFLTVSRNWNSGTLVMRYCEPRSRPSQRQRSILARISLRLAVLLAGVFANSVFSRA